MDPRLFEASRTGNVSALLELLQEDPLILHTVTMTSFDTPLHIASLLGHVDFASVVMRHNSKLTQELNQQGLSPLHLASAKGHLQIVKDFLNFDPKLGLLKDQDGRTPLHCAAIRGKVQVLTELLVSCPESALELTSSGETVLHLAVKTNQYNSLVSLIDLIGQYKLDQELFNIKNEDGDTILHQAAARKQPKIVKLLVTKTTVDVNEVNLDGLTALDVVVAHPTQSHDKDIEDILRAVGGIQALDQADAQAASAQAASPQQVGRQVEPTQPRSTEQATVKLIDSLKNGIMVMAVMFATLTFEMALNPPGGVWQDWQSDANPNITSAAAAGITDGGKSISWKLLWTYSNLWKNVSDIPNVTYANAHRPGKAIDREYAKKEFLRFLLHDASCFFMSLGIIVLVALMDLFDYSKEAAGFLMVVIVCLLVNAVMLFQSGLTLVTDNEVSRWAVIGGAFSLLMPIHIGGTIEMYGRFRNRRIRNKRRLAQ